PWCMSKRCSNRAKRRSCRWRQVRLDSAKGTRCIWHGTQRTSFDSTSFSLAHRRADGADTGGAVGDHRRVWIFDARGLRRRRAAVDARKFHAAVRSFIWIDFPAVVLDRSGGDVVVRRAGISAGDVYRAKLAKEFISQPGDPAVLDVVSDPHVCMDVSAARYGAGQHDTAAAALDSRAAGALI